MRNVGPTHIRMLWVVVFLNEFDMGWRGEHPLGRVTVKNLSIILIER